jgi:transcriptional regulator with XRE-family HTH domain
MAPTGFDERFPSRRSPAVKALASNVQRLRRERGWTQGKLAAEANIEQNAVSLIENGRSNPTVIMMETLAKVLGVAFTDLFELRTRRRPNDK